MVQAQDDTFIPFEIYRHPAFASNPYLTLVTPERGGHLGFISREKPRFWLDGEIIGWIESHNPERQRGDGFG
jgi:predicted alpha/beta-fold hydrolase